MKGCLLSDFSLRLRQTMWELGFLTEKPEKQPAGKGNLLFFLSGLVFLSCYVTRDPAGMISLAGAAAALAAAAWLFPPGRPAAMPLWARLLALLSAAGTAGAAIRSSLGVMPLPLLGLQALLSLWFLYCLILRLYKALGTVLSHAFSRTDRRERLVLGLLAGVIFLFTAAVYSQSTAFYNAPPNYDVIYTADSPLLYRENVWLSLTSAENDLRQPLFAVFSAPFVGAAYVLSFLFGPMPWLRAAVMDLPQLLMLVLGFYLLSALLSPGRGWGRLAMTASLCAMYASLLFMLTMEQYLTAVFWLLVFLYMAVNRLPGRGGALMAASGSLLTSAAMLPLLWEKEGDRPLRRGLQVTLAAVLSGAFLMLLFRRLDVVLTLGGKMEQLGNFTGEALSLKARLLQYVSFAGGCFVMPPSGVLEPNGYPSWQLLPVERLSTPGLLVLALCLLGAVAGRKEKTIRASVWWWIFSVIMLVFVGWGTAENGLILYGLYFGWMFYVLARRGLFCILDRLGAGKYRTVTDLVLAGALLAANIPGLCSLLRFAAEYYPV